MYMYNIMLQTESGNEEVVKELLLQGANVDLQDNVRLKQYSVCTDISH